LPAGHNGAGCATGVKEPVLKVGLLRSRPARIRLLDSSLYIWLGAKALSQFLLMGGDQRGILL
jgi:hypothetical protein